MEFKHIDMENEKVKRIVRSSYEVFALNDIKKASTNMIVKSAEVSRGILYHYFKDKEELFNFLVYHSVEQSVKMMDEKIDWDSGDVIKRICDLMIYRLDFIEEYPYGVEFGEKYRDKMEDLVDVEYLRSWRDKFLNENIEYSIFKEGIKVDEAIHIVRWTYKGLWMDVLKNSNGVIDTLTIKKMIDDCNNYYKTFVTLFYK